MWREILIGSPAAEYGQGTQRIVPSPPLWPPLGTEVKEVDTSQVLHSWHLIGWFLEAPYSLLPFVVRLEGNR